MLGKSFRATGSRSSAKGTMTNGRKGIKRPRSFTVRWSCHAISGGLPRINGRTDLTTLSASQLVASCHLQGQFRTDSDFEAKQLGAIPVVRSLALDLLPKGQFIVLPLFCDGLFFFIGCCRCLVYSQFGHGLYILGRCLWMGGCAGLGDDGLLLFEHRRAFSLGWFGLLLDGRFAGLFGVEARRWEGWRSR